MKKQKEKKPSRVSKVFSKTTKDYMEHLNWNFLPVLPDPVYAKEFSKKIASDIGTESICGVDDMQHVEQYDGTLGVTQAFVAAHERPVGQLQWNNNLATVFTNAGNVSGVRWCSGTLITNDLFLSAGHCFDINPNGWNTPTDNNTGLPAQPEVLAVNMHVNFNYQVDPSGNIRTEQSFPVLELTEYRRGGLDFSIVRLGGNPGSVYGIAKISPVDANDGNMLCIIQHPEGLPKRIEAGPQFHLHDSSLGYDTIDTLGGSSGSGILRASNGLLVGVHTNGGCQPSGEGHNHGVRISSIINNSPTIRRLVSPSRVIANFGFNAGSWRVNRHPRFVTDLTGDRRADVIGFGNAGVWVSRNNGNGTFQAPQLVVANFGFDAGSWRVDKHPRLLADVTGNSRPDIVGFGNAGVWVSRNNGGGTFQAPQLGINNFGYDAGNWRVDKHPRFAADVIGDGRADIVGFGNAGVWVSRNNGNGTFQAPQLVINNFGYDAGSWRVDRHPRFVADLTGDGKADIIGFGNAGVWVSRNNGNGTFQAPQLVVANFGYDAGGWRVDRHPRFLADTTGDGRPDIVGFGNAGVWVSRNNGNGTFQAPQLVVNNFGYDAGGWRVDRHPRLLADTTGDGRADIVGFGNAGVWVSRNNGNGTFQAPQIIVANFGYDAGGWRVENHPRFAEDLTGDGKADIVGFGNEGVWTWIV